jgi:hypothetical protein
MCATRSLRGRKHRETSSPMTQPDFADSDLKPAITLVRPVMSGRHPPPASVSCSSNRMRKVWEQLSGIAATFERERDVAKSVCRDHKRARRYRPAGQRCGHPSRSVCC